MQKKLNNWILPFIFLLIIAVLTFVVRTIRLEELYHFTYDEEVFAFVGKRMFINHHIPLIGGVTPMHFHVAPYFYWLSAVVLFISKLNPVGWGIAAAVLSVVTVGVLFFVSRKLFNTKTAALTVGLYCLSFYQNIYDRHYWGLSFDGLISILTIYFLYKMVMGGKNYVFVLALIIAFGFHTDLSTLNLFLLSLFVIVGMKVRLAKKQIFFASALFGITFSPLILFDIRHDFSNSRGIIQYFNEISSSRKGVINQSAVDSVLFVPRSLVRSLYVFGNTDLARQYSYCPVHALGRLQDVPNLFALLVTAIIAYFFFIHRRSYTQIQMKLIIALFALTYMGLSIYGVILKGDLFDHYLGTLYPIFYLIVSSVLINFFQKKQIIIVLLVTVYTVFNLQLLSKVQNRFGYSLKQEAVRWVIAETGAEPFSLDVISSCFRYNGYRYLFYLYGKEPAKSYVDANFTYLYDIPPVEKHPKTLVVITNPDYTETKEYFYEYEKYVRKLVKKKNFGNIEILIIDNSNLDFVGKF